MMTLAQVWEAACLAQIDAARTPSEQQRTVVRALAGMADENGALPRFTQHSYRRYHPEIPGEHWRRAIYKLRKRGWLRLIDRGQGYGGSLNMLALPLSPDEALALISQHQADDGHA